MLDQTKKAQKKEYIYDEVLRCGDLVILPAGRYVKISGQPVALTLKEFDLLVALASAPGQIFTRTDLLERVWNYSYLGKSRTVDVHIASLRKKLEGATRGFDIIQTIWGKGYRFLPPRLQA